MTLLKDSATHKRKNFNRPTTAVNYLSMDRAYAGPVNRRDTLAEERAKLPTLAKLRPVKSFNSYAESDSVPNAASEVICAGNVFILGADAPQSPANGDYVGILKFDSEPEKWTSFYVEGDFYLPIEWQRSATNTATPFSGANVPDATALSGKIAYYDVDTGYVTDNAAGGNTLVIGTFGDLLAPNLDDYAYGGWRAVVRLDKTLAQANNSSKENLPADSAQSPMVTLLDAHVEISAFAGLTQSYSLSGLSNNPDSPVKINEMVLTVDGTVYNGALGQIPDTLIVEHTSDGAATGDTVTLVITKTNPAASVTATYTVDMSATLAPANWARS